MNDWSREAVIKAGMLAYRRQIPREDNPYKWTPNSRQGDAKRAWWCKGWDAASDADRGLPR